MSLHHILLLAASVAAQTVFFSACPAPSVCLGKPLALQPGAAVQVATQAAPTSASATNYFLSASPPSGFSIVATLTSLATAPTDYFVVTSGTSGPFTLAGLASAAPGMGPLFQESAPQALAQPRVIEGYFNANVTFQLLSSGGGAAGATLTLELVPIPCAAAGFLAVEESTQCVTSCPAGTYVSGNATCAQCPLNTFALEPTSAAVSSARSACVPCAAGTTSTPQAFSYGPPTRASGTCTVVLGSSSTSAAPPTLALAPGTDLRFSTQVDTAYDAGVTYALTLVPPPDHFVQVTLSSDASSPENVATGDAFLVLSGGLAGLGSGYPTKPPPPQQGGYETRLTSDSGSFSQGSVTEGYIGTPLSLLLLSRGLLQGSGVQGLIKLLPQPCSDAVGKPLGVVGSWRGCVASCSAGYWKSSNTSCTPCPADTFSATEGATSAATCLVCPIGKTIFAGSSACDSCTYIFTGLHYKGPGMTGCSECPEGSVPVIDKNGLATSCTQCQAGFGSALNADTRVGECVACGLGSFKNASMSACAPCPSGSIGVPGASPAACAPCPAGHYSANSQQCLRCSPGTYAAAGSGACTICDAANCGAAFQVTVRTLAGSRSGFSNSLGPQALFNGATGVDVDRATGVVFVSDTGNNCLRRVTPAGLASTLAGTCDSAGGFKDGQVGPLFRAPGEIAWHAESTTLYVCDSGNNRIRRVRTSAAGGAALVSTLAGSGAKGKADGLGQAATFNGPLGCALSPTVQGSVPTLYVSDTLSNALRRVSPVGAVLTLAGGSCTGDKDGAGPVACLNRPTGLALSANGATLYFADSFNRKIKALTLATGLVSTLARMPSADASVICDAVKCPFDGLDVDAAGTLLFVDSVLATLFQLAAFSTSRSAAGLSSTPVVVAGTRSSGATLDGTSGAFASLGGPRDVVVDAFGRIVLTDSLGSAGLNTLKVLQAEGYGQGTLAGGVGQGSADGAGSAATFLRPAGLASSPTTGNVFIADSGNARVRCVTLAGVTTTLAGGIPSQLGYAVDGIIGATFTEPKGLVYYTSPIPAVYVTDGHAVRMLTLSALESSVTSVFTIAGSLTNTTGGSVDSPDGSTATFSSPTSLVAHNDYLYVADGGGVVRQVGLAAPYPVLTLTTAGFASSLVPSPPLVLALAGSWLFMAGPTSVHLLDLAALAGTALPTTPSLLAGSSALPLAARSDGFGSGAAFQSIRAAAYDQRGALMLIDGQHLRALELDAAANFTVRTVLDLGADAAVQGLTASRAGLFFTVADASIGVHAVRSLLTVACPAGSYCPSRWLTLPCPAGRYGSSAGLAASTCSGTCPAGFSCPLGTAEPRACPQGSFCPAGAAAPTPCPPGSSNSLTQATQCVLCAPGQLAPGAGSLICSDYCPAGRFNPSFGGTTANASCAPCAAGSYAANLGSTACTECKAGRYSAALGAVSISACAPCPAGLLAASSGSAACAPCPNPEQSSSDGITCAAFACPAGLQSKWAAYPESDEDCTAVVCAPPLWAAPGGTASYCEGCPAGRAGAPGACKKCPAGALCPGGGSRPLLNFSAALATAASPNATAASAAAPRNLQQGAPALWRACPALNPGPEQAGAASLSWATYLMGNATTLLIVMGSLLGGVLLLYLAMRFAPPSLRQCMPQFLAAIDFFYLKRAVVDGSQPVARYSAMGGLWTLVALGVFFTYAIYIVLQWSASNTAVARALDMLSPDTWALAALMAPATAPVGTLGGGSANASAAAPLPLQASGVLVRLTLDGEPGACAALQDPGLSFSGLSQGSWAVVGSTDDCGGTGASQLTLACAHCDFTKDARLHIPLHYSCQSILMEVAAVAAYPTNTVTYHRALASAVAASRLSEVEWTVVPVLDVRVDNTTSTSARGYRLLPAAPAVTYARPPVLENGNVAFAPNFAGVVLTILLPVSITYISTNITTLVPWYTLIANLLGLSSIIGGIGMVFLILEEQRGTLDAVGKAVFGVELGAKLVGSGPAAAAAAAAGSGGSAAAAEGSSTSSTSSGLTMRAPVAEPSAGGSSSAAASAAAPAPAGAPAVIKVDAVDHIYADFK